MASYLIAVTDGIENVLKTVKVKWPDRYYHIEPNLIMISVPGISSPNTIKESIGISTNDDSPSGLVTLLKESTAAGVLPMPAVDWYRAAKDA